MRIQLVIRHFSSLFVCFILFCLFVCLFCFVLFFFFWGGGGGGGGLEVNLLKICEWNLTKSSFGLVHRKTETIFGFSTSTVPCRIATITWTGQDYPTRNSSRRETKRQTEETMGRQHQRVD